MSTQTDTVFFQSAASARRFMHEQYGVGSLVSSSAKIEKSKGVEVETLVVYLPAGSREVCPSATPACRALCLGHTSGHMPQKQVQRAQRRRLPLALEMLRTGPESVGWQVLAAEIRTAQRRAHEAGRWLAVRLNGTSDLPWHRSAGYAWIRKIFPSVIFYDYTKEMDFLADAERYDHHFTLSATEKTTDEDIAEALAHGVNVAVVFRHDPPEAFWHGFPVINGDSHDARFLDPRGVIVGLSAKGPAAKADQTGFVREA